MADLLPPRELAALRAAAKAGGLYRGRSGFYAGFETRGQVHLPATVRALERRKLLTQPDLMSPRRVLTDLGRTVIDGGALPAPPAAPAPIRSYID